jgi:hypothetical protein
MCLFQGKESLLVYVIKLSNRNYCKRGYTSWFEGGIQIDDFLFDVKKNIVYWREVSLILKPPHCGISQQQNGCVLAPSFWQSLNSKESSRVHGVKVLTLSDTKFEWMMWEVCHAPQLDSNYSDIS